MNISIFKVPHGHLGYMQWKCSLLSKISAASGGISAPHNSEPRIITLLRVLRVHKQTKSRQNFCCTRTDLAKVRLALHGATRCNPWIVLRKLWIAADPRFAQDNPWIVPDPRFAQNIYAGSRSQVKPRTETNRLLF